MAGLVTKLNAATPLSFGDVGWDAEAVDISTTNYTPSNNVVARGLYVGGAGNVTIVTAGGNSVTFQSVPAGTILPIAFTQVTKASTTATLMVALA